MLNKQEQLLKELTEKEYDITNIEDYKNMDSILSITCKNGHRQTETFSLFQKNNWECIECIAMEEREKFSQDGLILSLDAATNSTGWAILNKEGQLIKSGCIVVEKKLPLLKRIESLIQEIDKILEETGIEIVVIEDIQLEYNTLVFKSLAMLRGILFYHLEIIKGKKVSSYGADVWRSFSNIRGSNREEKKENTLIRAKRVYGKDFGEDEADAIFLAKYAFAQVGKKEEEVIAIIEPEKEDIYIEKGKKK